MTNKLHQIDGKFYQESDIVMLPTEDASCVVYNNIQKGLFYGGGMGNGVKASARMGNCTNQHLYFLSNEEIKAGDKVLHCSNEVGEAIEVINNGKAIICTFPASKEVSCVAYNLKKIIVTTDKSLNIKFREKEVQFPEQISLPRPSNEFLKAYCDKGGIDKVLILIKDTGFYEGGKHIKTEYTIFTAPDNTISIKPIQEDHWDDVFKVLWNPVVSMGTKEAMIREKYNITLKSKS